jgi:peptidoglycan/xylan/chitin deacetylase (PgdA/CDA1 family)
MQEIRYGQLHKRIHTYEKHIAKVKAGCWCTNAYHKGNQLFVEYKPKKKDVGKTVNKPVTVTFTDGSEDRYVLTAKIV